MTARVSIVVLNHNGLEHLAPCLGSLARAGLPNAEVEVVLVDNGSRDGSLDYLTRAHPRVRVMATGENLGFAGGISYAVTRTAAPVLVFLNNDTWVHPGWLEALVGALDAAPSDVAAVTGRIVNWDATRVDYRDTIVTFDGHAFQRDFGRPLNAVADDPPGSERLAPCGGNMAIRRAAFDDASGFDDGFFAYLEDVDLGLRLRALGYRVLYEPRATISHRSGATGSALGIYNRGYLIEKNALATVWVNFDPEARAAWLPAVLATFLHRTERIARERAAGGAELTVDPYRGQRPAVPVRSRGRRERLARWIAATLGVSWPAAAENAGFSADPHTLSQLRALHRTLVDLPRLEQRRTALERRRKISSREIFTRWPLAIVPTYPGDDELFASAWFAGLLPKAFPYRQVSFDAIMER